MLISILGDSLSTFAGYNPEGYSVYYDERAQRINKLASVEDTWWAQVIRALAGELCVNGSYSGSRVSGSEFPAASTAERISALRKEDQKPDLILISMGFNDFATATDISVFTDAYNDMLTKVAAQYSDARVICGTLMRTRMKEFDRWTFPETYQGACFNDYNNAIRSVCNAHECCLADTVSVGMRYETLDTTHPTVEGHRTIAEAWKHCLRENGFKVE